MKAGYRRRNRANTERILQFTNRRDFDSFTAVLAGGPDARMASSAQVTRLLLDWNQGNAEALNALMPVVYEELRRLARGYLRRERVSHTLSSRALVHEAYLRLVDQRRVRWQNRSHFFGISAQLM